MLRKLESTLLFDIYSPLLTEKQRDALDLYYNDDLSLTEIADEAGITRQGVMNCIRQAEKKLDELEEQLGLAKRFRALCTSIERLEALLEERGVRDRDINEIVSEIKVLL